MMARRLYYLSGVAKGEGKELWLHFRMGSDVVEPNLVR